MEWLNVAGQAVSWLVQQPAVQGAAVAAVTEAVKKAPVGPSGGPGVRLLAAVLALGSVFASAAAQGSMEAVSPEIVGQHVVEAVGAFLAAVGAWQLARKAKA
ncbi:MAG: hypothetical protein EBT13_10615 [Rhodobacteraceae bacterium]|nr:hypothetical protein [Paracoccaceae bacterium]